MLKVTAPSVSVAARTSFALHVLPEVGATVGARPSSITLGVAIVSFAVNVSVTGSPALARAALV